jgi:predicted transposase YbfD/YdcC
MRAPSRQPLHMVSAWAARQRAVLAQEAIDEKSNEIVAIPLLLERLQLTGALVAIDAHGDPDRHRRTDRCRRRRLSARVEGQLTGPAPGCRRFFRQSARGPDGPRHHTTDADHGRIEERRHVTCHHKVDWLLPAWSLGGPNTPGPASCMAP